MQDSCGARSRLGVNGSDFQFFRIDAVRTAVRLPYCLRILLENLLRHEDGISVTTADIEALARWNPRNPEAREIAFQPGRVLLQDFTGVPALVDLAALRDALAESGGDPAAINPRIPAELVIDHSIQVDAFGSPDAFQQNVAHDYARNAERYAFLRWGQRAFRNFRIVPPNTGICHQVNLEYLARLVSTVEDDDPREPPILFPDTCVGTDSHTPMVNGLGVLAWGVGGIEAEAVMLGQPISMLIPEVIGVRLQGRLNAGVTATDLVLFIAERLREYGVVGKFVEFFGQGVGHLSLADRATIGNMSPEYGATCAIFPPDAVTLDYLRLTGRDASHIALVEAYLNAQGMLRTDSATEPDFSATLCLDLATVEPAVAGPGRPQDRIPLAALKQRFSEVLPGLLPVASRGLRAAPAVESQTGAAPIADGTVVIAAITSCTNTSNPAVILAAGLLARNARRLGLTVKPWVKTSLAPGSRVVMDYLRAADLLRPLGELGFELTGYGCTTCIGNSGPLPEPVSAAIRDEDLVVCAVLSGNRNFEGRIHPEVRANFLMSPPLVIAFAMTGRIDWQPESEPLGIGSDGRAVFLRDIWPESGEIASLTGSAISPEMFRAGYEDVFNGDARWQSLPVGGADRFAWRPESTYIRLPPYFHNMPRRPPENPPDIRDARMLAVFGDSVTTDHISPAGRIAPTSPAGVYLTHKGVGVADFNSYGARRGNHEVMIRGTFANSRIRNRLAPGTEGGWTICFPENAVTSIYDAAIIYRQTGIPLGLLAGREYGSGSSRDWAAKGPYLMGVRFVIAESYERIHRSNLVGMGMLPLQFRAGENAARLGLSGREIYAVNGIAAAMAGERAGEVTVTAVDTESGRRTEFAAIVRLDTPREVAYYRHGGLLQYVLRRALGDAEPVKPGRESVPIEPQPAPVGPSRDHLVEEGSKGSFPASDPPGY